MSVSRAKLITFSAVAAGLVVLGAAVAQKDRLLERWYLYRLERAEEKKDAEEARRAVAGLGEVGSETAIVKLVESVRTDERLQEACGEAAGEASEKIIDRIGETRLFLVATKYLRNTAHHPIARSRFAVVPFLDRYKLNRSREIVDAKEAAIATFSDLLDSEDKTASLIAAACLNDLGESHLDNLSDAARETVKKEKQRAIIKLRRPPGTVD